MNISHLNTSKNTPGRKEASFADSPSPSKYSSATSPRNFPLLKTLSASMLQHSPFTTHFSKAERFPPIKSNSSSDDSVHLPTTLNNRSTSFGFGHKVSMSELVIKSGWDVPAPNQYSPRQWTEGSSKGKSFGVSYASYRKVFNPQSDTILPEVAGEYPGPGEYRVDAKFGIDKKKASLKAKGKMFNEMITSVAPSANKYKPNMSLVEPSRYNHIHFGQSGRTDFTRDSKESPGPGAYKISSKFDKYTERRIIEERLRERLRQMKLQ